MSTDDTAASTRPIRPETSSLGRFQFSLEKAKTVRRGGQEGVNSRTKEPLVQ